MSLRKRLLSKRIILPTDKPKVIKHHNPVIVRTPHPPYPLWLIGSKKNELPLSFAERGPSQEVIRSAFDVPWKPGGLVLIRGPGRRASGE